MRDLYRLSAVTVVLVMAGCTGLSPGETGPTQTSTATETTLTTPTATVTPTGAHPSARLQISSQYDGQITLTLVNASSNKTILNRTYPPNSSVTLSEEFKTGVTYRAIIKVGDDVSWNRSIYSYESYELKVAPNGSVYVDTYSEV